MQNHLGLIKVGRSGNVEHRRRHLERADRCQIAVVYVANGRGYREDQVHSKVGSFREFGEWYEGTELARQLIAGSVGIPAPCEWPYQTADLLEIERWLDRLEDDRAFESSDKLLQRCIREMLRWPPSSDQECRTLDGRIMRLLVRLEHGHDTMYFVSQSADGQDVYTFFDPTIEANRLLPCFTTNLADALSLWPDDERPTQWSDTTWNCCIAGLIARKAHIRGARQAPPAD